MLPLWHNRFWLNERVTVFSHTLFIDLCPSAGCIYMVEYEIDRKSNSILKTWSTTISYEAFPIYFYNFLALYVVWYK